MPCQQCAQAAVLFLYILSGEGVVVPACSSLMLLYFYLAEAGLRERWGKKKQKINQGKKKQRGKKKERKKRKKKNPMIKKRIRGNPHSFERPFGCLFLFLLFFFPSFFFSFLFFFFFFFLIIFFSSLPSFLSSLLLSLFFLIYKKKVCSYRGCSFDITYFCYILL